MCYSWDLNLILRKAHLELVPAEPIAAVNTVTS